MLKGRQRDRVAPHTPLASRVPRRSSMIPLQDVGIVPGSRFILLPLRKVSTMARRHRCCRPSATSTKTCIVQKATLVSQPVLFQNVESAGNQHLLRPGGPSSRRASLKRRRPRPAAVKTRLSPVSEEDIHFWSGNEVRNHRQDSPGREETAPRLDAYHVINTRKNFDSPSNCNRESPSLTPPIKLHLGQLLEQEKRLEMRQLPSVFDQFLTKDERFNNLVDEVQKRIARLRAERDPATLSDHGGTRRAAALKQDTTMRSPHHQRRANKRLRKVALKIHTFGRNRISPASGSHQAFQAKSIVQQLLFPPQMLEKQKVKSRRFGSWDEDTHGDRTSADFQIPKYWNGCLCSCASGDDLPIGPLQVCEDLLSDYT